jgi:hypothetical protein
MNTQTPAISPVSMPAQPGRSWWVRFAAGWDRFFFHSADPTTLGMMRICCGLIAAYTLVAFSWDLQNFFGEHAFVSLQERNEWRRHYPQNMSTLDTWENPDPIHDDYEDRWGMPRNWTHAQGMPIWSIWFHVTDPTGMAYVHAGLILVTILFTIGFCTRLTSVLTWFGALSYIHRSNLTVFGVDTMMTIALFYLMIGPSGAALSVDRLIKRWWLSYRALRRVSAGEERTAGLSTVPVRLPVLAVTPSVSANLAIRLCQIHVCIIYMAAGLSKLQGASWWTGEAIWGTLANFEFAPMQYDSYMAFLTFLAKTPWLWNLFMTAGTVFTLAFEIGFAFLVWRPGTRWVIIAMAVTLHGGIGLFMGLKTFSFMMLTLVMSFVPPEVIHRVLRALARGPVGLKLRYPARFPKAIRAAGIVHALDIWNQVELLALVRKEEAPARLLLETPQGEKYSGWALVFRLVRSLGIFRIFFPWNWLGVFRRTGDRFAEPRVEALPAGVETPDRWDAEGEVVQATTAVKQKR